jgi:hypothetical protein
VAFAEWWSFLSLAGNQNNGKSFHSNRESSLQAAASSFLSLRYEREVSLRKKKDKKFPIASRPYKAKDQRLSPVRIKKKRN